VLGWEFHDGDELHSEESKRKMHLGIALDDVDRAPWLAKLRKLIQGMVTEGRDGVVACSALKQSYRDEIIVDPKSVKVVYLKGSKELVAERLRNRAGHFMNPDLLQSQIDTLEEPRDAIVVDISGTPEAIVSEIRSRLAL
jgi:gluconokinase